MPTNKDDAFKNISDHIRMLGNYELIDPDICDTLIGYVFDYVMQIDTLNGEDLSVEKLEKIWKEKRDKNNDNDNPHEKPD